MTDPTDPDTQTRERAYQLWQEAGSPEGAQDEFWHRAKAEIDHNVGKPYAKPDKTHPGDDLVEAAAGHYPPTGDSQNFA